MKELLDKALPLTAGVVRFIGESTQDGVVAFMALGIAREQILVEVRKKLSGETLAKFNEVVEQVRSGEQDGVALAEAAGYDPTRLGHGGDA